MTLRNSGAFPLGATKRATFCRGFCLVVHFSGSIDPPLESPQATTTAIFVGEKINTNRWAGFRSTRHLAYSRSLFQLPSDGFCRSLARLLPALAANVLVIE